MSDNIKVVVKVRPLIPREVEEKLSYRWRVKNENILNRLDQNGKETDQLFTFDKVYDMETDTSQVYEEVAKPIVEAAIAGFNGTIFAYGQTSSGKTYTMSGTETSPGIIPLAVRNLFEIIKNMPERDFLVRVSYIEIYNETVKDLLAIERKNIKIHDTPQGVKVDVFEKVTSTPEEVLEAMKEGEANRMTGATNMNEESSRSHSIFQITIESREHVEDEEEGGCVNVSQLNLVDLAGSERSGQAGATGVRFKEGTHINKSLSALALVIKQLSEDPNRYANYRDSKLTRILQNSLGGNAKTSIICAVTPASDEETISTLQFANRAKAIKNRPEVNAVATNTTMIQSLTKQLSKLQAQLEAKRNLEVMLQKKTSAEQELQKQIENLRKWILNGFEKRTKHVAVAPRRMTISAVHNLHAHTAPAPPTVPRFCTPTLKYNPMAVSMDFVPIQSASRLPSVPEENRLVTPPPPDKEDSNEVIEIDSDDEKTTEKEKDPNSCSPYHDCYRTLKTPPCVLRKTAKQAEKNLRDIVELTEREKIYTPSVVELMEKLEENAKLIGTLNEEIDSLKDQSSQKDCTIEELKAKIDKTEQEVKTVFALKSDLESKCKEYYTKIMDCEVTYENLLKKSKSREDDLLSLLEEQKIKAEDIGKLNSFMDMSKDISLVNSDSESSSMTTIVQSNDDNPTPVLVQDLCQDIEAQLAEKNKTILELESTLISQRQKIESLESTSLQFQMTNNDFLNKLTSIENENSFLKSTIDTLHSTIESQKILLETAQKDIKSYNSTIQELQIKLVKKDTSFLNLNETMIEALISDEQALIANNDNIRNIIVSLKTALDERTKEVVDLKTSLKSASEISNNYISLKEQMQVKEEQMSQLIKEAEDMQDRITENMSVIKKLMEVKEEITNDLTSTQQQNDALKEQSNNNKEQINSLKSNNDELTRVVAEKEIIERNLVTKNEQLKQQVQDITGRILSLEKEMIEKEKNHLIAGNLVVSKLLDTFESINAKEESLPITMESVGMIFHVLGNKLESLDTAIKNFTTAIKLEKTQALAELETKLSAVTSEYNTELANLKLQFQQSSNEQIQELDRKLNDANKICQNLRSDLLGKENKISILQKQNSEKDMRIQELTYELDSIEGSFKHLIHEKDSQLILLEEKLSNAAIKLDQKCEDVSMALQQTVENRDQMLLEILEKTTELIKEFDVEAQGDNCSDQMYDQILINLNRIRVHLESVKTESSEFTESSKKEVAILKNTIENKNKLLHNILNKATNLIQECGYGDVFPEVTSDNLYKQIITALDEIGNRIAVLQSDTEKIETTLQRYEKEITVIKDDITKRDNTLFSIFNKCSQLVSAFSIKNMPQGEDDNLQLNEQILSHLANISRHIDLITTENTETKKILDNYGKQIVTESEFVLNIFNKTAKLLRYCSEQSVTEEFCIDNAHSQIIIYLDEIINHMTNLKIEKTDLSSTKDMVENYKKETTLLKETFKKRNTFLQDILGTTNNLTKEWDDINDGSICADNNIENVYERIHKNITKIVEHITHLNAEINSIKLSFRKKFEEEEIAVTEIKNKSCLLREIIARAKRMNPENNTIDYTDETSSDLRREIMLVLDNTESYIKTLNSEKDKMTTLLDEKLKDFQKTTQENIKAHDNELSEILNKCLTLSHICHDGKSPKYTSCGNKQSQILLILDKLSTCIPLLKTKYAVERSDIEEMLKRALKEIEHLSENNFSLMNELTRQSENCETLKRENFRITTIMKHLLGTNDMLTKTVNDLQASSSETETIESEGYQVEDFISRKYVADSDQDSVAIHQSPHSLLSLCLNKINEKELNLGSLQTCAIRNCVETQTEKFDDKNFTTELNQIMAENVFFKKHLNELESTMQWLLQEREEVQKEINLLLEPAGELQKKIANHRTNLSTLTATTYAENKLLQSQLKVLKHHHTRYTNVCQRDLPGFKSQLSELMSILKGSSFLADKQNASVKRYSLPDVLDESTSETTFKIDSTLDGDLLMLDTNLTLTSADNTLISTQTCQDVTQMNFFSETTAVNDTIEILTNDNQKMLEQLETLRLENLKLKDEVRKSTKQHTFTKDVQLSPIKKNNNGDWVSAIPHAVCDKCVNLQTVKHKLTIENERLIDELERIAEEKQNIEKMYNNLSLEIPSTDALAQKLINIEKDNLSKLQLIKKLTNDLNKNKIIIKELQQENETLSVQLMENISEVDDLKKELDCHTEAKAELEEKILSLLKGSDSESNNKITCSECKLKEEMIKTLEEKQLSKINRSLSDSDSSMRYNKICTLQNELHASKEDCKKITEEVATIKNQLERSNVSPMDMDESVGDSNIFALTKGFDTSDTTKSKASEEKSSDIYESEQIDCLNFYLEKTGVDKENVQSDIKIIDIMKMLYNNLIAKHGNEVENLLNKLKDFEEPRNNLQTKLLNVSEEYVKIAQSLEHNNETVKKVMNALSKVKENTNLINEEMDNIPETEKNTKLLALFKENLLKVLDTEFGLSFINIFESLIDSIVNKHQNDLSDIMGEYTKLQTHMETVAAEFHSVNENLLQMKIQLSDKEKEYNLLKSQKEKINEISNAVTLDIINREKKMTETFAKGCEKLIELKIIAPFDCNTTISVNENIQQLFERILSNHQTYLEIEKEKQDLVCELDELKTIVKEKEKYIEELQFECKNNLLIQNLLEDKNKAHNDTIEALIKEVTILREDIHEKDNTIKALEQKMNASKNPDVSFEKHNAKDLITQLENLKEEHENLQTINDMINSGNETQLEELEKARELINKYKTELDSMTSDILVLRESVKDNVYIIETLTEDTKSLMEKNEQLNKKFAEKTEECLRLEMNIKTHEKTAEIQSKMIVRLQKQKEEAESTAKETNKKLEALTNKHTALQRECDQLSENLKTAKGEIEGLKTKKETLELQVSELEAELSHDGHRKRMSVEAIAENARRRRQSIHDSQRTFEGKPDDHHKMEEMFASRTKPDDLFMDVDGDNSNCSSPIRLSKGRDSFSSRQDQCDSGEDGSRPSSVARTRRRRQSIYDMHRYSEDSQSPNIMKPDSTTNDSELSQLREQLQACQQELEDMKEKYRELDDECETCAQYLREREDQCRQLKKDKSALERLVTELNDKLKSSHSISESKPSCQNASVNTDEDWANLHSVVVDRMSFDAEVEKNKRLSRVIDELRANKQELKNTIAKMQRALDKYVGYRETKELEATRAELAATRQELVELQERYRELDEECETCGQYLRERDEQCRKLREAKRALETRLAELEGSPTGAMQSAGRRRRQTQHDLNRHHPHTTSAGTETCEDFLSYQVERDDSSSTLDNAQTQELKRIKMTLEKVMKEKSALESQLLAASQHNPVFVATGSAIVQNQQLTDVMKENQKLKKINAKLITICKKRNKSFEANRENEEPSDVGI